jgi:intein-encoded DNA endonuclease-like protein
MNNRKHTFNQDYFENIDNEHKAYWLGFITADGYINSRGNTTGITLDIKDINHLQKFLDDLDAKSTKIHLRTGRYNKDNPITNKCYINLYSRKMNNDLQKLGITTTKSNTLKPLSGIPEHLIPHFIRGYFDGDGCVFESYTKVKNRSYYEPGITFVGTYDFMTYLNTQLPIILPSLRKDTRVSNSYTLYYRSKPRFLILEEYLYKNSTIYLDRKFEKCKLIKDKITEGSETKGETPSI